MHDLFVNIPALPSVSPAGLPPPDQGEWDKAQPVGTFDDSGLDSQPTRLSSGTGQGNVALRRAPRQ